MTSLPLELQGQLAVLVAMLCLCSGAVLWEAGKGPGKWLGRITIAAGIFQLAAFSEYAVNQYEVVIARVSIPALEVANSDNGRERTIERIDVGNGIAVEREYIPGWHFVSAAGRGYETNRRVLQRAAGGQGCGACLEGCCGAGEDCECSILGVPGCGNGICADCQCNPLEFAGNSKKF